MKISRNWFQGFFDAPLPDAAALADALTFHVFEIDGIEEKDGDAILDVKVTANRGHDCLGYRGIAKEISAILNIPIKQYEHEMPLSDIEDAACDAVSVSIDVAHCNRYIAGVMKGVKVGPSPQWLVDCLVSMGQKSINNVVDATNFVMFNIGQPLHAFDAGKLTEKDGTYAISVRTAREGEKLYALDEKEYALNPSIMVIIDANSDTAIGVAGVKGGMPASITADTTHIIIESASFDGVSVRKAAQHMKIRTDASARFEQGMSPEWPAYAMRDVVTLIKQLAGGEVVGFTDEYSQKQEIVPVSVTLAQTNAVLGTNRAAVDVADAFTRLQLSFTQEGDTFTVTPPFERLDLIIPEDLIEEIGRIVGYDTVPEIELPEGQTQAVPNEQYEWAERIRTHLTEQGFSEVFTSVFADTGERLVANKVDGVRPYLRTNLSDGLDAALERNIRIKDLLGVSQVKLFEIGTVWKDGKEEIGYDLAVEKLKKHKTAEDYKKELEAALAEPTDAAPAASAPSVQYQPFSKYPFIVRDIAMWTPSGTDADMVLADIRAAAGELCVRAAMFDRFEKEGRVSLAFRLVFQSFEKTLTDDEANAIMGRINTVLVEQGFEIR